MVVFLWIGVGVLPALAAEEAGEDEGIVKLDDIVAAAQVNHAAVDERYVGKKLQIRGRVQRVQRFRDEKGGPVKYLVRLEGVDLNSSYGPDDGKFVPFVFNESERGGLADLTRGSLIVVQAICQDTGTDDETARSVAALQLRFEECKLMRIEKPAEPPAGFLTPPSVGPGPTPPSVGLPMVGPFPAVPPMALPPPRP
jgi:hypothetical protein